MRDSVAQLLLRIEEKAELHARNFKNLPCDDPAEMLKTVSSIDMKEIYGEVAPFCANLGLMPTSTVGKTALGGALLIKRFSISQNLVSGGEIIKAKDRSFPSSSVSEADGKGLELKVAEEESRYALCFRWGGKERGQRLVQMAPDLSQELFHPQVMTFPLWPYVAVLQLVAAARLHTEGDLYNLSTAEKRLEEAGRILPQTSVVSEAYAQLLFLRGDKEGLREVLFCLKRPLGVKELYFLAQTFPDEQWRRTLIETYGEAMWEHLSRKYVR